MKKLLILLFSLFLLSPLSVFADDISDFQIEGISIGDSLLDYMTEDEILKEIENNRDRYPYLKESYEYVQINLYQNFPTYDSLIFFIKNSSSNQYVTDKNEKYTIRYIAGNIDFINDFEGCVKERDEISESLSSMFSNTLKTKGIGEHPSDPSGDSIMDAVYYTFDSGAEIDVFCDNFEETFRTKMNWNEGLTISVSSPETTSWLQDYK